MLFPVSRLPYFAVYCIGSDLSPLYNLLLVFHKNIAQSVLQLLWAVGIRYSKSTYSQDSGGVCFRFGNAY